MEAHSPSTRPTRRAPRGLLALRLLLLSSALLGCDQQPTGELSRAQCSNSLDDDGDGLEDCADPDCGAWVMCSPEFLLGQSPDAGEPGDDPDASPCDGGTCGDVDDGRITYALRAAEAQVPVELGAGECLDDCTRVSLDCICLPDPYVQIALDGEVVWRSTTVRDTLTPTWVGSGGSAATLELSPQDEGRLRFIVVDDDQADLQDVDPTRDDVIFGCAPPLQQIELGQLGCSASPDALDRWVLVDAIRLDP